MREELYERVYAEGSYKNAIRNIVCHLDTLLTDEEKTAINWHPEQSVSLAVMRIISELHETQERLRYANELYEANHG